MIDVGGPIPLNLQLHDAREDLEVIAQVIKPTLESLIEVRLSHVRGGLYLNQTVLMPPNTPFVIANYLILEKGKPSLNYENTSDVFYANPAKEDVSGTVRGFFDEYLPRKDDYYIGIVFEHSTRDDFLEGRIIY